MQNIAASCHKVDCFEVPPLMVDNEIQTIFVKNLSKLSENTALNVFLQKFLEEKTFVHELEPLTADYSLPDTYAQSLIGMIENNQIQALTQKIPQTLLEDLYQERFVITDMLPYFNKNMSLLHEQSMVQGLTEKVAEQTSITTDAHLSPQDAKLVQAFAMQSSRITEQKAINFMAQGLAGSPLANLEANILEISNKTLTNDYAKSFSALHDNNLLQKLVPNIQHNMGRVLDFAPLPVRDAETKSFETQMQLLQEQRCITQLARLFAKNEQHLPTLSVNTSTYKDFIQTLATLNGQKIIEQLSRQILKIYVMGKKYAKLCLNNINIAQFSQTLQKSIEQKRIGNITQDMLTNKYNSKTFSRLTTRPTLTKNFTSSLHKLSDQNKISCIYKEIRNKRQTRPQSNKPSSKARQSFRNMCKLYEENHINLDELRAKCSKHPELQTQFTAYQAKLQRRQEQKDRLENLHALYFEKTGMNYHDGNKTVKPQSVSDSKEVRIFQHPKPEDNENTHISDKNKLTPELPKM